MTLKAKRVLMLVLPDGELIRPCFKHPEYRAAEKPAFFRATHQECACWRIWDAQYELEYEQALDEDMPIECSWDED